MYQRVNDGMRFLLSLMLGVSLGLFSVAVFIVLSIVGVPTMVAGIITLIAGAVILIPCMRTIWRPV
jgi:hypothetical protein